VYSACFLETSAHKSHRYISRYPEIFEKKSRLIVRKIRYLEYVASVSVWFSRDGRNFPEMGASVRCTV